MKGRDVERIVSKDQKNTRGVMVYSVEGERPGSDRGQSFAENERGEKGVQSLKKESSQRERQWRKKKEHRYQWDEKHQEGRGGGRVRAEVRTGTGETKV